MTPYISPWHRFVGWLLWHFEGYGGTDEAKFYIIDHPEVSGVASLMRDYWYVKRAKEVGE